MRTAVDRLASALAAAGATVRRDSPLLPDQVEGARIYMRLLLASVAANFPPDLYRRAAAAADGLDPDDVTLFAERARGTALSYRDWIAADVVRTRHRAQWRELFTEFDIVLCPVVSMTAFPHDHSPHQWARTISIDGTEHDYSDQLAWAGLATAPGLPATAAPIARSAGGLPIGVQLIGPMLEDYTPIRFAELLEREFGGFTPPPLD